jgi:hypothetical protein
MEKCYRLHGFPPGYKFTKGKNASSVANQVSAEPDHPQLPITYEQCQQLMNMFKPASLEPSLTQSASVNKVSSASPQDQLISHMAGKISVTSHVSLDTKHSVFASSSSLFQKTSLTNSVDAHWIIDTGATDHMICTVSLFTSITSVVSRTVKLPNGQFASVTHIGTLRISESFLLTDFLCIPSFSFNLISVSKLIKMMHCCFIFLSNFCFIQHLTRWMTIGVGKEEGGLYYLLQDPVSVSHFYSTSNKACTVLPSHSVLFKTVVPSISSNNVVSSKFSDQSVANSIWHYRLGHLSDIPLKMLSSVIPHFTHESNKSCSICPLAKQHKLSFPHSEHISQHSFDLIHCDL